MIRPAAFLSAMLAAGAGLYLYQVKHRTLVLDTAIAQTLKQADEARARTALLRAEYAMLNQPDRLRALATRYLDLQPLTPGQYTQLADLDAKLPPREHFPAPGEVVHLAVATPANTTDGDAEAPATLGDVPVARVETPVTASRPVVVAEAVHARRPPTLPRRVQPDQQYAAADHPRMMPMAAPRPVASTLIATAAERPAALHGPAAYAQAEARPYRPAAMYSPPPYVPSGGSMLGNSGLGNSGSAMAPPVPISN